MNQAVQGDDVYYIAAAEHAQIDPLHPNHVHYLFEGRDVDFQRISASAAKRVVFGRVDRHLRGGARGSLSMLAYIVFSLIGGALHVCVSSRVAFHPHPVWATLLFPCRAGFRDQRKFVRIGYSVPGILDGGHLRLSSLESIWVVALVGLLALGRVCFIAGIARGDTGCCLPMPILARVRLSEAAAS